MADPNFYYPEKIDALIGVEVFYDLLLTGKIKLNQPGLGLRNTKLDWVVSGRLGGTWNQQKVRCNLVRGELCGDLEKFWAIEETNMCVRLSKEEEICEQHFLTHVQRTDTGQFMVKFPFNNKKQIWA